MATLDELARQAQKRSAALAAQASHATVKSAPATPARSRATPRPAAGSTQTMVVDAVAYHLPGHTASGLPVGDRHRRGRPDGDPSRHAYVRSRLRTCRRGRRGLGGEGQDHRPLDAVESEGAGMGSAYRHDHHLRLTVMRSRWIVALGVVVLCVLAAAAGAAPAAAPSLSSKLTRALKGPTCSPDEPRRSRSTSRRARSSTRTTTRSPSSRPRTRSSRSPGRLSSGWARRIASTRSSTASAAATGPTWEGDLVLKGFGDPTLATSDLAALAGKVRSLGITTVTGRIRGDESFYDRQRGVAELEARLPRDRVSAALRARRRSRVRLAGALAPSTRRQDAHR